MKTLTLILITALLAGRSSAQSDGPNNASSFTTVSIPGSSQTWINLSNAASSDDTYATFGNIAGAPGSYTDYLVASDFGCKVPYGANITGIIVEVERSDPNFRTADYRICIVKNGVISSTNKSASINYATTDGYQKYGNITDLWGESWTASDINASGFGIAIAAQRNSAGSNTAGQIDHIRVVVYFDFTFLPVTLTDFSAMKNNKEIKLQWSAKDEMNISSYEIERSADGRNFFALSSIAGMNQGLQSNYSFDDINPLKGISYYRLKIAGTNGLTKYSKTILAQFGNDNTYNLYPNPIYQGEKLYISNPGNERLNIRFYSQVGKMVSSLYTSSDQLSTGSLAGLKGEFTYRVYNARGGVAGNGKIILQ